MPKRRGISKHRGSRTSMTMKRRVKYHGGRKRTRLGRKRLGGRKQKSRRIKRGGMENDSEISKAKEDLEGCSRKLKEAETELIRYRACCDAIASLDSKFKEYQRNLAIYSDLVPRKHEALLVGWDSKPLADKITTICALKKLLS